MAKPFKRILITGAAGRLGGVLRQALATQADVLRLTDIASLGPLAAHEEGHQCDLADYEAVLPLLEGVDTVVHAGGVPLEDTFAKLLNGNIVGTYNIYEAARRQGVKRVIYTSTNHVIGFYDRSEVLDASVPHRPDTLYGLTKCFGEDLGRYYWDKFGIESVNIRIGSSFERPLDRRMLATWLSFGDFAQLVERALLAPRVAHMVVYGMSNNRETLWDNHQARSLGFVAKDSADAYREQVEAEHPPLRHDEPAARFHGGNFAGAGHFED
ncbi:MULTISPECIES: NAD(P)-dependent oxidoreductase [unclassified Pseudomonas]|uniref:NAD-dependent epimerase/dehydratase family protein n=1 Tax=unclassified Pseudomonas TaxID=196821 RepID=UPI000BCCEBB8|nr:MULTISPECIES: NAD(P)-dependent oxidoreductase [unclassified Pseudomonas]PVZ20387.1 uronate dehydrogenase [Pseudomonas sp. URIL14HWK12:I12]PVZ27453.1 uronate dehydrogenase [Pseudomonas sp. URIL14HWK12:I10]PVZ38342.1 uronate dehydrogenase [Pseudomonas sp. URIL14HWK12:I11]SNZ03740.1 uronate dehydrogenase [Pseudomonas sp. URIL14HWK12:I9]